MQLEYAFLANNAEILPGGRMHLFGADFNTIVSPAFPSMLQCAFVAKLSFGPEEEGDHHGVAIEFCPPGQDWQPLPGTAIGDLVVGPNAERPEMGTGAAFIAHFMIAIPNAGTYRIRLLVDEQELKCLRIYIQEQPPNPA